MRNFSLIVFSAFCVVMTGCTTTQEPKPTAGEIALKENTEQFQKSILSPCKGVQNVTLPDGLTKNIQQRGQDCR